MGLMRGHAGAVILVFSAASLLLAGAQPHAEGADMADPVWTVMVYMAADSEPALPWEEDINEMEAARPPDWMNVVALVDPLGTGDSMIFEILEDDLDLVIVSEEVDDSEQVIPSGGEADMASPETLADFISFASLAYPADRLALVLWGHSGGWYGMCQDGSDLLAPPELGDALETAAGELGRSIDIVIADCCTEGVIETAFEVRDHADWYVGSEIAVPAQGLRYDLVLAGLAEDRGAAPEAWGSMICETHRMTLLLNSWSATMAVYDLAAMDGLAGSIAALSDAAMPYVGLYRDTLEQVLVDSASSDLSDWYLDAGDVLRRIAGADLPLEVRLHALLALVAYGEMLYDFESYASPFDDGYADALNYTGAAIYCPGDDLPESQYPSLSFAPFRWGEMTWAIRLDEPQAANAPGPEVSYADTDEDGEMDEATLHWEEGHEYVAAQVFADTEAGVQLLAALTSDTQDIVLSGLAGNLLVSASAWDGTNATSHHMLNITLTRSLDILVTVLSPDGPVTDGVDVFALTRQGEVRLTVSDGAFAGLVEVPGDAEYGDLLTVEVRGKGGEVVAQNRTAVTGSDMEVHIRLAEGGDDTLGPEFVVPALLLVTCAAAAVIYIYTRRALRDQ